MAQWKWSAEIAILFGAIAFALIFIPLLMWQYRRYGRLSFRRTLGAAALAVYGVAIVSYTLLPLPSGDLDQWCAANGVDGAQTTLFHSLTEIREQTAGMTLMQAARSMVVLQVAFNVLLFIPWGVLVRRFLGWGIIPTVVSAFAVSVLIESTQYTGIWGLIPCSYRVADVDDVFTNTLGGLIGALIAPIVLAWMPRGKDLHRARTQPRPVTIWRRWFAMFLDWILLVTVISITLLAYRVVVLATGGALDTDTPAQNASGEFWGSSAVALIIVVVLPPLIGSGASLGQRVVWLRPVRDGRQPPRGLLVLRAWSLFGVYVIGHIVRTAGDAMPNAIPPGMESVLSGLATLAAAVALLSVPFTRGHRGASSVIAGLDIIDARTVDHSTSTSPPSPETAS